MADTIIPLTAVTGSTLLITGKNTIPKLYTNNPSAQALDSSSLVNIPDTGNAFLTKYNINSTTTTPSVLKTLQDFSKDISENVDSNAKINNTEGDLTIRSKLNQINTTYIPILRTISAILREKNLPDPKVLQEAKEKRNESKRRLEVLENPEQHVSYYEGWFPIIRPLQESSLFILFGISLFTLFFSTALLLRMNGVQVDIQFPTSLTGESIFTEISGTTGAILGTGLGLLIGMIVYYYRG